jgi:hypothetical protein
MGKVLLGLDGAGQLNDLRGEAPLAGFLDPALGIGEAGEIERQQLVEGAFGLIEARLKCAGRLAEWRDDGVAGRRHLGPWIAQQRLAGGGVGGDAPGGEEGVGLARAQAVAEDRVGQARLVPARERREGRGRGGGQPAGIDVAGHGWRQPTAEGDTAVDPAPAAPEQLGDLRRGELVVVGQRAHHAGLVHRAQRPAGGVGLQQPRLAHDAGRVFDDHRHVGVAGAGPGRQALETVQDLVGAVAGRRHAQGQRGQRARRIGPGPAQRRQRGGQPRDRELKHAGNRRARREAGAGRAGSGKR